MHRLDPNQAGDLPPREAPSCVAPEASESPVYQIRIKGHLGRQWTDWFGSIAIALEDNGDTLLTGPMVDQAALHGLLRKVRDLGMPLLAVNRIKPDKENGI